MGDPLHGHDVLHPHDVLQSPCGHGGLVHCGALLVHGAHQQMMGALLQLMDALLHDVVHLYDLLLLEVHGYHHALHPQSELQIDLHPVPETAVGQHKIHGHSCPWPLGHFYSAPAEGQVPLQQAQGSWHQLLLHLLHLPEDPCD
ncbi:unnamed protein product [Meganyctiphanes norvegica]|uniref:Uncharacterized protein n=1 Tax=Meganyctiphanes norvegica TaxID=48144 RepID=A0AAV2PM72_MEGNR